MSSSLTLLAEHGETLQPWLWVAVIASLVFGFFSLRQGRVRTTTSQSVSAPIAEVTGLSPATQIERLFALIDGASQSTERAMAAHAAAAKHLDSAEYQLLRLFDEFPSLSAVRRQNTATAEIVRMAAPGAPRALAA